MHFMCNANYKFVSYKGTGCIPDIIILISPILSLFTTQLQLGAIGFELIEVYEQYAHQRDLNEMIGRRSST